MKVLAQPPPGHPVLPQSDAIVHNPDGTIAVTWEDDVVGALRGCPAIANMIDADADDSDDDTRRSTSAYDACPARGVHPAARAAQPGGSGCPRLPAQENGHAPFLAKLFIASAVAVVLKMFLASWLVHDREL